MPGLLKARKDCIVSAREASRAEWEMVVKETFSVELSVKLLRTSGYP